LEEINTIERFTQLKQKRTIFVFTANWCPDCSAIKPFLPMLEIKYDRFQWAIINRDKFLTLGRDLDIFGIPSFIAYENGIEIGRFVSKLRKTKNEIESFLDTMIRRERHE